MEAFHNAPQRLTDVNELVFSREALSIFTSALSAQGWVHEADSRL